MARNHPIKILWYGSETDAEGNPIIPKISPSFEKRLEGLNAVSYTHLDVYKRQLLHSIWEKELKLKMGILY